MCCRSATQLECKEECNAVVGVCVVFGVLRCVV